MSHWRRTGLSLVAVVAAGCFGLWHHQEPAAVNAAPDPFPPPVLVAPMAVDLEGDFGARGPIFSLSSPCRIDDWRKEMHWDNLGVELLTHTHDPSGPNLVTELYTNKVFTAVRQEPGTLSGWVHCGDGSNATRLILPRQTVITVHKRLAVIGIQSDGNPFRVGQLQTLIVNLEDRPSPAGTYTCVSVAPVGAVQFLGLNSTGGCLVVGQQSQHIELIPQNVMNGVVVTAVANPQQPVQFTFDIVP